MRCVIVDDNRWFLAAARTVLHGDQITVVGVASNSIDAVDCVRRMLPDFTLVDVDLGSENGLELATLLHEAAGRPSPPRVILTSTEPDFGHLVDHTSTIGFLPKSELSVPAVLRLLHSHSDSR